MELVKCRDCGQMIRPTARGCWMCGRNLVAEARLAKYLWMLFVPALLLFLGLLLFLLLYRRG